MSECGQTYPEYVAPCERKQPGKRHGAQTTQVKDFSHHKTKFVFQPCNKKQETVCPKLSTREPLRERNKNKSQIKSKSEQDNVCRVISFIKHLVKQCSFTENFLRSACIQLRSTSTSQSSDDGCRECKGQDHRTEM